MANVDRISFSSTLSDGNEEIQVRKDGNVINLGQFGNLSIEEKNTIKEFRTKLKESDFDEKLNRCFQKGGTSDEPGQDAKVSGPSIKVNETYSEEIIRDVFGGVSGQLIGELTGAKSGKKYQTFFGWLTKYFKKSYPTSRPT